VSTGPAARPPVAVRPIERADWAAVADLTVAAYVADGLIGQDHPYAGELRHVEDRTANALVLVATDAGGGPVLGAVTFCRAGSPYAEIARTGEAEFRMLAVDPAHRGRGAGLALVRACLALAREAGDSAMVLSTLDVTASAQRIYARLGFTRIPDRDWEPIPGTWLRAYRVELQPG